MAFRPKEVFTFTFIDSGDRNRGGKRRLLVRVLRRLTLNEILKKLKPSSFALILEA